MRIRWLSHLINKHDGCGNYTRQRFGHLPTWQSIHDTVRCWAMQRLKAWIYTLLRNFDKLQRSLGNVSCLYVFHIRWHMHYRRLRIFCKAHPSLNRSYLQQLMHCKLQHRRCKVFRNAPFLLCLCLLLRIHRRPLHMFCKPQCSFHIFYFPLFKILGHNSFVALQR